MINIKIYVFQVLCVAACCIAVFFFKLLKRKEQNLGLSQVSFNYCTVNGEYYNKTGFLFAKM